VVGGAVGWEGSAGNGDSGRPGNGGARCEVGPPNTFRRGIGRRPVYGDSWEKD
jgi:hypothetical protein